MNYKMLLLTLAMGTSALSMYLCDQSLTCPLPPMVYDFNNDMRCMFMGRKEVCFAEAQAGTLTIHMVAGLDAEDRVALHNDINEAIQDLTTKAYTPTQEKLVHVGSWATGLGAAAILYFGLNRNARWSNAYDMLYLQGVIKNEPKAITDAYSWESWKHFGYVWASCAGFIAATAGWAYCKARLSAQKEVKAELANFKDALEVIAATPATVALDVINEEVAQDNADRFYEDDNVYREWA